MSTTQNANDSDPSRISSAEDPLFCVKSGPCPCLNPCQHAAILDLDLPQSERALMTLEDLHRA